LPVPEQGSRVGTNKFTEHRSRRYVMKNSKLMISVVAVVCALLTPALAQNWAVRATIPFDFTIGNQTLSAGEYRISINGPAMLRVARINGPEVAGVMTSSTRGVENVSPRLIFHRYGKQYFLAEVWVGELNLGHQLLASPAELEIARTTKQESTTILAAK
jgi:hypothetical protein